MGSYLETIPCDILQDIAFQATVDPCPALATPRTTLSLLLASSTIYHTLCTNNCPHLYANIFRAMFDIRAARRRLALHLTDSALACELVFRRKMLRSVQRRSFIPTELRQNLWTAFWMIQESDGLNEAHLRRAGLLGYLLDIVKCWSGYDVFCKDGPTHELQSLVIWLLCFTLSREIILSLSPDIRHTLLHILLPYCWSSHRLLSHDRMNGYRYAQPSAEHSIVHHKCQCPFVADPIIVYAQEWIPQCPDPAPAATNLLFCLKEIDPLAVPEHLPETRTIAIATQRFGPTKEDVWRIREYRTKLFSDTLTRSHTLDHSVDSVRRSEYHDFEFQRMVSTDKDMMGVGALSTICGTMRGTWEGFYMMAEVIVPASGTIGRERQQTFPDLTCRKPLQAVLTEFVCLDNSDLNLPTLDDISGQRNLLKLSSHIEGGFELNGHKYERLTVDSNSHRRCGSETKAREPVDLLLLGETLEDHAQAWGGFRYAGRIHKDGSIVLKREPKGAGGDGVSGAWIFEGRVRFGTVFVGRWYSGSSPNNNPSGVRGIFSMQKRVNDLASW